MALTSLDRSIGTLLEERHIVLTGDVPAIRTEGGCPVNATTLARPNRNAALLIVLFSLAATLAVTVGCAKAGGARRRRPRRRRSRST